MFIRIATLAISVIVFSSCANFNAAVNKAMTEVAVELDKRAAPVVARVKDAAMPSIRPNIRSKDRRGRTGDDGAHQE